MVLRRLVSEEGCKFIFFEIFSGTKEDIILVSFLFEKFLFEDKFPLIWFIVFFLLCETSNFISFNLTSRVIFLSFYFANLYSNAQNF